MDDENPLMECEVCGGTDFHKEAGHFYCNECQTQSQQIREHVFEQDDGTVNKKSTKKIQKEKPQKTEDLLTSWECYNYVLKGLTQELIDLGAKPELAVVVRCLWMKYLHKCEVFNLNVDRLPKVSILGPKKDVAIVYNVKKRKRQRSRTSSTSTTLSVRRQRATKKRALIHSQYEELSQSQTLTQESSLATDTLSSLKTGSESSDSSGKVYYNRYSNSELKHMTSLSHRKKHQSDVLGEMKCHKRARSFRIGFITGPTNLTSFTLYTILYIGLLIVGDPIQLGDLLRFIREGHLSFGCYRHFFHEDISDKALNLSQRKEKLFSHGFFRKRCAKMALFLDVASYMNKPDLVGLCSRYCTELNLPNAVFECVEKLVLKTAPKMVFNKRSKTIPNYEGRAMSFILFCLKLLFGLDGVTEEKLSEYAYILNNANSNWEMFNFLQWLQFIGYRHAVVKNYHLPTSLRDCASLDSDKYLNYLKNQNIKFKGSSRHIHSEVKDYLQVLDNLLDNTDEEFRDHVVFEPTLTPFSDYTSLILNSQKVQNKNVLTKSFKDSSLEFLLRPNEYLKLVGNKSVKNRGANNNIIIEDLMYLYKTTIFAHKKSKGTVAAKISDDIEDDMFIEEYLELTKTKSLKTTNLTVLLSNWQKGNEKEFLLNKTMLKLASENVKIQSNLKTVKDYPKHYNVFERYWLNIPTNPIAHYFAKHDMEKIFEKFPHSFRMVLNECARIVEQDICDFFSEFLVTELCLVNFDFGCKNKKNKTKGIPEIRKALANCAERW